MGNLFNYKDGSSKRNGRLFYEVWGDMESQNSTLKVIILAMSLVSIISLFISYYSYKISRVPVVIRVNSAGNAQVLKDLPFNNRVGKGELLYFSKSFIREFTGFNSIMIKTELSRALNKMSPGYGEETLKSILKNNFIIKMQKANITSYIKFKKVILLKQTVNHDELLFYVIRNVVSNKNPGIRNSFAYEDKIILERRKRSIQYPFGLEVVFFDTLKLGKA